MRNRLSTVLAVGLATAASACVDARARFNEFDDRVGTIDASTVDGPEGMLADINGMFLFAADPGFVPGSDPATFVQYVVTWSLAQDATGGSLDASYRALCTNQETCGMPPSRTQVGDAIIVNDTPVTTAGAFTQPLGGTLPMEANPVTMTMVPINVQVIGTIIDANTVCGTLTGMVGSASAAGSTFGAIRVSDVSNLPAPVFRCPTGGDTDGGTDAMVDAP